VASNKEDLIMKPTSSIAPDACYWVGADVAKKSFDVALVPPGAHYPEVPLRDIPAKTFQRTPEGVASFLAWIARETREVAQPQVRMAMEATGSYSTELTQWVNKRCPMLAPAIVNPRQIAAFLNSMNLRNKTDRIDARGLAFYGAERRPVPFEAFTPERQTLRELSRYRDALVAEKVRETNRSEEPGAPALVKTMRKRRLKSLDADIKKIEAQMAAVIEKSPELKQDLALLVTMPGVAFITAAVVLAELGDLRRFKRARQASAFAGLSPRNRDSGTSVHARPKLCKQGNPRIRQALYLSAMAAIRKEGPLKAMYARIVAKDGLKKKAAVCAVARKMITMMRAILISGKPYDPLWKTKPKSVDKP